ncbi:hypothetical protein EC973_009179 [Apophysomyces ossiformis]|uniref:Uncharacterized protein n=1 Tax=Apophysomyces ossiformis TaxID=679940 RepID=A0A8H7BRR5_9FUNG|nr:hypothetical protein EC973_009179 [Apophysomyces ossiformis]
MSENSLFQFAQVISDLPMTQQTQNTSSFHPTQLHGGSRYLPIRKYYGLNCTCSEVQPRRGKNLPEGSLDSRAKKLHPQDKEDYEFSINWLSENAHSIYKDENNAVVGLCDLAEVSLCKAHSSTLYRAKKRHERSKNQAPPSPADSSGTDDRHFPPSTPFDPYPLHHHPHHPQHYPAVGTGGLAAKVREISYQQQQHPQQYRPHEPPGSPDFSNMSASTSLKRKRTSKSSTFDQKPHSSASTPLYATGMAPLLSQHPPVSSSSTSPSMARQHVDNFSSQLPPLHHTRTPSLSSLSSSLQHQLQLSNTHSSMYQPRHHEQQPKQPPSAPSPAIPLPHPVVETVSLRSAPATPDAPPLYYIRNLAITDTFTFRDLLTELDMTGTPPPGKRIVVSDEKNERMFPMDQAIRSVIRRPVMSHVDLCLGLTDKPSIDWSTYT